ncbi:MAG: SET domain-containing protein [Nitrospira sp.]|nr:SET domain-containing protein [Nitrospira sp.]
MLHPHTELRKINETVGYGVFATKFIPRGTITWALDPLDQILNLQTAQQLDSRYKGELIRYSWVNGDGHRILCWDFGRYMNHCCEANCYGPGGFQFELAVRDIHPGEELTCEYATLNLEEPLMCQCNSLQCRGIVSPDDIEAIAFSCDTLIQTAFTEIRHVAQPLWTWIESQESEIEHMRQFPNDIPSVLNHRWQSRKTQPSIQQSHSTPW